MRSTIVGCVGLSLGLLVANSYAQEAQWRPVSSTSQAGQPPTPIVTLRAPVPNAAPVSQTSYSDVAWTSDSSVVRATVSNAPLQPIPAQPVPVGPDVNEKGPDPRLLVATPVPSPVVDDTWSNVGPNGVTTGMPQVVGPMGPMDGNIGQFPGPIGSMVPVGPINGPISAMPAPDNACCGTCGDGGGTHWWSNLWHSNSPTCCDTCADPCNPCCNPCSNPCCDTCCNGCCAPRPCFWVSGEYLLWATKGIATPPLVTTNSTGNPPNLGTPGTQVAYQGSNNDWGDLRSGARITVGFALPCTDNKLGFEATGFYLSNSNTSASFGPTGSGTNIGRPFIDVTPNTILPNGNQNNEPVDNASLGTAGTVTVKTTSQLWGGEFNMRYPITCGCNWKLDFLAGFRYLQLNEDLSINENLAITTPETSDLNAFQASSINTLLTDNFHTRNDFYGGQIGMDAECRWGRWFVGGIGKLALGDMHQVVDINGATLVSGAGLTPTASPGGLLALQGTNIGMYSRDKFAIVPECELKVGFYFTEHIRAFVGYDILYASSVVRPGDQVDLHVNTAFQPGGSGLGAALPAFQFRTTDYWAQGLTAGLELRF